MEGIEEQRSSLLLNISGCKIARLSFVSLAPPRCMARKSGKQPSHALWQKSDAHKSYPCATQNNRATLCAISTKLTARYKFISSTIFVYTNYTLFL